MTLSEKFWNFFDSITRTESFTVGNHRLILNGRATIGPNFHYLVGMLIALSFLVLTVLEVLSNRLIVQIIFLVLVKIEFLLLLSVACTEPGIVPRKSLPQSVAATTNNSTPPGSIESIVNGVKIDRKWCYTCNLYRPSRGKHCALCNCCVDKFDHHCVWMSNCIAERNYRKFFLFIFNSFFMSLFVLASIAFGSSDEIFETWKSWLVLLLSFSIALLTGNLFLYHLKLILRGSTSYETMKSNNESVNPFSLGDWRMNLNAFLSRQTDPSQMLSAANSRKRTTNNVKNEDETITLTNTTNEFGEADEEIEGNNSSIP